MSVFLARRCTVCIILPLPNLTSVQILSTHHLLIKQWDGQTPVHQSARGSDNSGAVIHHSRSGEDATACPDSKEIPHHLKPYSRLEMREVMSSMHPLAYKSWGLPLLHVPVENPFP
jgi:hypothetical protein